MHKQSAPTSTLVLQSLKGMTDLSNACSWSVNKRLTGIQNRDRLVELNFDSLQLVKIFLTEHERAIAETGLNPVLI